MKLFVRDLTVIDASYLSAERGMVGESWLVDIELTGTLNEMSMLLDFARVKKQLKAIIDAEVDHRLLVPIAASCCQVAAAESGYHFVDFLRAGRSLHLNAPSEAFAFIPEESITQESVTRYLHQLIQARLPSNIDGLTIRLRPEAIPTAFYHYSHGLKKHDGNCQRIAHGHRSMIELWVDERRELALEQEWAARWADIYLGSQEDVVPLQQLQLSPLATEHLGAQHLGFRYQAPQGDFQLAIAAAETELVDTDTTVELLAHYIARQLKPRFAQHLVRVVAYEGVGKGAIAEL
ncbi:6-carboxytetrahydropterin synthase [Pseudaeromonas pectinilytica]